MFTERAARRLLARDVGFFFSFVAERWDFGLGSRRRQNGAFAMHSQGKRSRARSRTFLPRTAVSDLRPLTSIVECREHLR